MTLRLRSIAALVGVAIVATGTVAARRSVERAHAQCQKVHRRPAKTLRGIWLIEPSPNASAW